MKKEMTVDRIEENMAILVSDDDEVVKIPSDWIEDIYEGMAVDISFTHNKKREEENEMSAEDLLAEIKKMNPEAE